jgi:hypothetical protein
MGRKTALADRRLAMPATCAARSSRAPTLTAAPVESALVGFNNLRPYVVLTAGGAGAYFTLP